MQVNLFKIIKSVKNIENVSLTLIKIIKTKYFQTLDNLVVMHWNSTLAMFVYIVYNQLHLQFNEKKII